MVYMFSAYRYSTCIIYNGTYSGSGVLFFVFNGNGTEMKRKYSINGFFETRFEFFSNFIV